MLGYKRKSINRINIFPHIVRIADFNRIYDCFDAKLFEATFPKHFEGCLSILSYLYV